MHVFPMCMNIYTDYKHGLTIHLGDAMPILYVRWWNDLNAVGDLDNGSTTDKGLLWDWA